MSASCSNHEHRRLHGCDRQTDMTMKNTPINSGKRVDEVDRVDRFSAESSRSTESTKVESIDRADRFSVELGYIESAEQSRAEW